MSVIARLKAYVLGIRDGWEQPYNLSTSANVEHLGGWEVQNTLDAGINLGQFLRAGVRSQSFTEYGYPFRKADK